MTTRRNGPDLGPLDPGGDDPGYWHRFQARVLEAARPELARRRRQARTTVLDVINAWSRLVAPAAVAATALATVLLVDGHQGTETDPLTQGIAVDPSPPLLGVEDILLPPVEDPDPVTQLFISFAPTELDRDAVLFLVEGSREP